MTPMEALNDPIKRVERIINSFVRGVEKSMSDEDTGAKRLSYHLSRMKDALIILKDYGTQKRHAEKMKQALHSMAISGGPLFESDARSFRRLAKSVLAGMEREEGER